MECNFLTELHMSAGNKLNANSLCGHARDVCFGLEMRLMPKNLQDPQVPNAFEVWCSRIILEVRRHFSINNSVEHGALSSDNCLSRPRSKAWSTNFPHVKILPETTTPQCQKAIPPPNNFNKTTIANHEAQRQQRG